jgi:dTDP-glucose pyrophosphorylase/predicted transcriptional regulator
MTDRWREAVLPPEATLQAAIQNLNATSLQIVLVADDSGTLVGTITDGDIRRGLLRGSDLASQIGTIVFRDPLVVPPQLGRESVLQLMQANRLRQVPIVDEHRQLVGLHVWDNLFAPTARDNVVVIMVGGQGTRLRPYTENCPKPMLPVAGKPMLEHTIERLATEGFRRFTLAIHYLGHVIEEHFGDGDRWGVHIDYVREDSPLGTAGAISLLHPRPDKPFIVCNGDVLSDIHFSELLEFHGRYRDVVATMAVRLHEWQHPFGVVRTNGVDIVGFEEKPVNRTHVNAGIYVLEPSAVDALEAGEYCTMPGLFARLKDMGRRTIVYPMHEPWLDVGRPADLERAGGARSSATPRPTEPDQ